MVNNSRKEPGKKSITKYLSVLIIALFLSLTYGTAYSETKITSQKNNAIPTRKYQKVLVHGNFEHLEYRRTAEEKLCEELQKRADVSECLKHTDIFFPGEKHTDKQVENRIAELQIDAIITLSQTGSRANHSYIPPTTRTNVSASVSGNRVTGTSKTYTYGGHNITTPVANYEVTLFSIIDGKVAWYATAVSHGSIFSSWNSMARGMAKKTIKQLISDAVFEKAP